MRPIKERTTVKCYSVEYKDVYLYSPCYFTCYNRVFRIVCNFPYNTGFSYKPSYLKYAVIDNDTGVWMRLGIEFESYKSAFDFKSVADITISTLSVDKVLAYIERYISK